MAGINLAGGFGAGGGVDALRVLIAEKLRQQIEDDRVAAEQASLVENQRQANQRNVVDLGNLDVNRSRADIDAQRLAEEKRRNLLIDPVNIKHTEAGTGLTTAQAGAVAQDTTQGATTFAQDQADREQRKKAIAAFQPGPTQTFLNLSDLGMKGLKRDDVMTAGQRGQEAAQEWQGGGNVPFLGQEGVRQKNRLEVVAAEGATRAQNEKLIPVVGPSGTTILVPQSQAAGMTPGVNPRAFSSGTVDKLATIEQSLSVVNELSRLKKDEWLGPVAGYVSKAKINMPGVTVPEDLAAFAAQTARLKDATIQAITGAAVGVQESKRIMGEIPDFTDKPEVWTQKANATVKNLTMLHDRIMQLSGKTPEMSPAAQPGGGAPAPGMVAQFRYNPQTGKIEPIKK